MPVQFIIGRSGTGKTHRCFTQIVDALRADPLGPPIFWLLPRQATFSAERDLTCASGLGGFVRARVVSFEQLGHEILAECGGGTVPELTPVGRQMILGHLLRQHVAELKYFKNVAKHPGLAAKLDAAFSEFERAGKDAGSLDVLLADPTVADNPALVDKVHDLHLIYNAYSQFLGQDRFDQHRRLKHVLGCIQGSKLFKNATIYVDGFLDFSEYEHRVLAQLGKECRVEITLPIDPKSPLLREPDVFPDDLSLFHPVEIAYRRLRMVFREESTPVDEPHVTLSQTHRFKTAALAEIERSAFNRTVKLSKLSTDGVELIEAATREAEVDAASRRIRRLLMDGYRLRDIVVLARDVGPYHDLIHSSFREHGIRYFLDRRRQTAHHPLLQFVRAVLVITQQDWPHEWLMTLLKTGLSGLASHDADELENYVLRHRIQGGQWISSDPWTFHASGLLHDIDEVPVPAEPEFSADTARRHITGPLESFVARVRGQPAVREVVAALFEVIERFPIRQTLAGWIAQAKAAEEFSAADEHTRVWTELTSLFDQMVELLGDEPVTPAAFQEILEAGLESFDLALTPPTVDEVLVGQVNRTRPPSSVRAVLVLGLSEGVFPAVHREDSVLTDSDRRVFHDRQVHVNSPSDRRVLDEYFWGYTAFTSASDLLYLSRPRSDDKNHPLGPSVFWQNLVRMFPRASITILPRETRDDPALIATPRQLVTSLMRWVRRDRSNEPDDSPFPALYHWLATQACQADDTLDGCRYGASRALAHQNQAVLSHDIVTRFFASPLRIGVSQLETVAACPFKHFLQYGLGLQPRESDDGVSALDLGNVYHQILDKVLGQLLKQKQTWEDLTDAQRKQIICRLAEQISHGLRGDIFLSSARNRYLLDRIERTLNQVVATQKIAAARGTFRAGYTRVRFGDGGTLPEFTLDTPAGAQVHLSGKIDRVDLHPSGDATVVDYRLGDRRLHLDEVYHGLSLELLTYLLVLDAHGELLAGRKLTPAAAFYVRMLRWLGTVDHPAEALSPDDPRFHLATKPRGILDERVVRQLDTELTIGASDVINVHVTNDGSFGYRSRSDGATADEFGALLNHVKHKLGALADQILAGDIAIKPYMLGQKTPCPHCEFRSVCRFEPVEHYNQLTVLGREGVLDQLGGTTDVE